MATLSKTQAAVVERQTKRAIMDMMAPALTDEALADRLRRTATNFRWCTAQERNAYLEEAARRLDELAAARRAAQRA